MFPDLRLLISATVVTFFLAATAGLYASLRITQEQITVRAEARSAIEDTPITRIATAWPAPEPGRAAALRELAMIAKYSPAVPVEPASAASPDELKAEPEPPQSSSPAAAEAPAHAPLEENRAQKATGSTGIAVPPETGAVNQADHPDIHGNIAPIERAGTRIEREIRTVRKKSPQASTKKTVRTVQRRRKPAPPPERPADQLITGYPLYLTVPVTN